MRQGLKRLCKAGALGLPLVLAVPALAQQPVVEDLSGGALGTGGSRGGGSFYEQATTQEEAGGRLLLFNEVQRNQEELRQLRGQVEELRYQLEQLRRQTRQQYMDIEDRLASGGSAMPPDGSRGSQDPRNAAGAADNLGEQGTRNVAGEGGTAERSGQQPSTGGDAAARSDYQAAFAKVQAREFAAATQAFEAFVAEHPDSQLTGNAYYWLGELHSAASELEPAEAAFRHVLEDFPESSKVPDTLYKLGLLKARQGEPDASRELLERVRQQYPDSSAASLAGDFLRQSGN